MQQKLTNAASELSLGVSIVLYETPLDSIAGLLNDLAAAGAAHIQVIDNTPGPAPGAEAAGAVPGDCATGALPVDRSTGAVPGDDSTAAVPYARVQVQRTGRNLGFGRAHNIALRSSVQRHKYHLICNPDITLSHDTIGLLHAYMEANPEVGLCMPKLVGPDGRTHYCCRRSPVLLDYVSQLLLPRSWGKRRRDSLEMRAYDYDSSMEVACLSGCFMFFRSEVLRCVGGFDERFFLYFEDLDLSARARQFGKNVYVPSAWVIHQRQSGHRHSWLLKLRFAASAMRYFSKWGWFRSAADDLGGKRMLDTLA